MQAKNTLIRTAADELVELVKAQKSISVEDVSKKLGMPITTVQALVDFLVEEKIFGIEYKFTTPYIYLYRENIKTTSKRENSFTSGMITKEKFYEKAKSRKILYEEIEGLWRKYLRQNLVRMREEFVAKSREKKLSDDKIEELWDKYLAFI
jgi:phage antirepressor YoqD-like protein